MLSRNRVFRFRATALLREARPPEKPEIEEDWNDGPGSKAPKERGLMAYIQDKRKQAQQDAANLKLHGFKGAIAEGRKQQSELSQAFEKDAEKQASLGKLLNDRSPTARMRDMLSGKYNPHDHFLLMDLDVDKDAAIFGNTREEFYENVEKMKRVILEYNKWERQDNFYYWGTKVAQLLAVFFVYDSWEQERYKVLLASSLDNFKKCHEEEIEAIAARRHQALERAVMELEVRPPNFDVLVVERSKLVEKTLAERKAEFKPHPMDTVGQQKAKWDEALERKDALVRCAMSPASVPAVKNLRRVLLPQGDDWTVIVREEMLEYKNAKNKVLEFPDKANQPKELQGLRQQTVTSIMELPIELRPQVVA